MGMQMIDAEKLRSGAQRKRLGKGHPHQEAAQKAGAARRADQIERARGDIRPAHEFIEERPYVAVVFARGQLRHDTAEEGVDVGLAGEHRGHGPAIGHQGQSGFIAGAFYAENKHGGSGMRG